MMPRDHLERVFRPNLQEFHDNYGDLRRAFNAAAAIDALAAHIYWWAMQNRASYVAGINDSGFRKRLAAADPDFKLTFEVAKANKHVQLTQGRPSVANASQIAAKSVGFGEGRWGDVRWDGPLQVFIEPTGAPQWGAEGVFDRALAFLEAEMAALGIP